MRVHVCRCACTHMMHGCMGVREQTSGVGSLLPSWRLRQNRGCRLSGKHGSGAALLMHRDVT